LQSWSKLPSFAAREMLPTWLSPREHSLHPGLGPTRARIAALIGFVACAVTLVMSARISLPFITDDAFISLRYSARLIEGKGLTWSDYERVEGYSNFLWVVGTAAIAALSGFDAVLSARLLGTASAIAAIAAIFRAVPAQSMSAVAAMLAGAATLAFSTPLAVWAIGGLEQPLAAGLLAWGLVGALRCVEASPARSRQWLLASVSLGLLCLTRPDGLLIAGGVGLGVLLARPGRASLGLALRLAIFPALLSACQLLFRWIYYHDTVPNTAYAKAVFTEARVIKGLGYIGEAALRMPILPIALAIGIALLWTRRRARSTVILVPFALWTAYVIAIGGDIFPAFRHVVVLVVMSALLLVEAVDLLRVRLAGHAATAPTFAATALVIALAAIPSLNDHGTVRPNRRLWEWDGQELGSILQRAFGPAQPLLAVDAAGSLPYFSRLPALDMLGLNDRFLARNRPPGMGHGRIGHELGDGAYVLSRKPDLVVFCKLPGNRGPCWRSGKEMIRSRQWRKNFRLMRLQLSSSEARVWVRMNGPVGLKKTKDLVQVPAFVMSGRHRLISRGTDDGRILTSVGVDEVAQVRSLRLQKGTWLVSTPGSDDMQLRVKRKRSRAVEGVGPLRVRLKKRTTVDIEVKAPPGEAREFAQLTLQRQPDPR
jgi:arabinofuranosyltransferase